MAYDVVLGLWCAAFGGTGAFWTARYTVRGPWRRITVARVLRVWEPEPGQGWSKGVPAEVGYVDPAGGREMLGVTRGGGGGAGRLDAAWPGREVEVFARRRRPDDVRVSSGPPRRLDAYLTGAGASLALIALPLAFHALFGRHGLAGVLGTSAGVVLFFFIGLIVVLEVRDGRRRKALLAAPARTTARVVDVKEARDPAAEIPAGKLMTPVLSFTTADGAPVTAVCEYHARTQGLRPGDEVELRYTAADPSVFAVGTLHPAIPRQPDAGTGTVPALREAADGEPRPSADAGSATARTWVGADGFRVRADRVTAVEVSDDGLLLHVLDRAAPIPLTPGGPEEAGRPGAGLPADPAERRFLLERLADELLGCVEDRGARHGGVLIRFTPADERRAAGFTTLPLRPPEHQPPTAAPPQDPAARGERPASTAAPGGEAPPAARAAPADSHGAHDAP